MNHAEALDQLDLFLDGALAARDRWAVAEHLADCRRCQHALGRLAHLRGLVYHRLAPVAAPPALARRVAAAVRTAEPARQLGAVRSIRPLPVLLAAALCLTVVAAALWWSGPVTAGPAPVLATQHTLFARDDDSLEVTGDGAAIATWFAPRLPFPVPTPALPDFTLQGGRLAVVEGQRAAQLVYEDEAQQRYVSLLIFQPAGPAAPSQRPDEVTVRRVGQTLVCLWGESPRLALVGDLPESELRQLAAAFTP